MIGEKDNRGFISFSHKPLVIAYSLCRVFLMCNEEAGVPESEYHTLKQLNTLVKQSC